MKLRIIQILLVIVTITACKSSQMATYTTRLNQQLGFSERQLSKVQFYLDQDVVLQRVAGQDKAILREGRIILDSGREVDEVLIKARTPGQVVDKLTGDRLAVSFDSDPNTYLVFGPNTNYAGKYVLLAKKWEAGRGQLNYGGQPFTVSASSRRAGLMLDLRRYTKVSKRTSSPTGRRVD